MYGFYGIDYYYIILVLPAILLGLLAQMKVKSTFAKYSNARTMYGLTGAEAARRILDANGLYDVAVVQIGGSLTDNYNPSTRTVSLSSTVYDVPSVASVGVAAHECGHAIQHAKNYAPMKVRTAIVPVTNIGSTLSMPIIMIGFIMGAPFLVTIGILLFSLMAVFQLVTLPVEFNASNRAIKTLKEINLVDDQEIKGVKSVLGAAALTYVAALITSLAQLLRLILLANRRND